MSLVVVSHTGACSGILCESDAIIVYWGLMIISQSAEALPLQGILYILVVPQKGSPEAHSPVFCYQTSPNSGFKPLGHLYGLCVLQYM